jgi:hypothetical protein
MKRNPDDQSRWPEVQARLEQLDSDQGEGIVEALRRDAEIDNDPNQAVTLLQLDSQLQNRRSSVRAEDDRK